MTMQPRTLHGHMPLLGPHNTASHSIRPCLYIVAPHTAHRDTHPYSQLDLHNTHAANPIALLPLLHSICLPISHTQNTFDLLPCHVRMPHTQETFAHLPRWIVSSLIFARRGWVTGRNAPLSGPLVMGHVHVWPFQSKAEHKSMVRKVSGLDSAHCRCLFAAYGLL